MVHKALEGLVKNLRENPAPHPKDTTYVKRREVRRAQTEAIRGDVAPVEEVVDVLLDLGDRTLEARHYVPFGDESKALVVYFHGGSFVIGDLETNDALCRRISADTKMRLMAIDYRLAPEHPFPAGVNDAVDVFRYVVKNFEKFAEKNAKLIVMGDSAGAALVTVAAALTRDEGLGIVAQVLVYPTLGPELFTESAKKFGTGYFLEMDQLRYDYQQYLGDFKDHTDPRVTPLLFPDLTGAPPAIIVVAGCDPLRDEGVAYAGLLEHFGVKVELLEAEGMIHGFLSLGGIIPECLDVVDDLAEHMHHYVEIA
jgi:acetyl esterase